MALGKKIPRALSLAVALLFVLISATTTPFWRSTAETLRLDMAAYPVLRTMFGFHRIPMDEIVGRLNVRLAPGQPVALGEGIESNAFFEQRFTEGLYPRLIEASSPYRIEIVPDSGHSDPAEEALGRFRSSDSSMRVVLLGRPASSAPKPPPLPTLEFSWSQFLGVCAAVLGIGLAIEMGLPKTARPRGASAPFVAVILCALFFGTLATGATWLQIPARWSIPAVLGSFLLVGMALFAVFRHERLSNVFLALGTFARRPESLVPFALLVLFADRIARFPIIGWDGRSIWLFKAKQLFEHGMIARSDIVQPFLRMSHVEYPLLFPAWASFFSSLSGAYNERMASMAIPVLLCATIGTIWVLSRKLMGRWIGSAFTLIAFFSVEGSIGAGYIDGLLCLLVVIEFLAFALPDFYAVAWIAAAAASLLKREGLILAGLTALFSVLLQPALRKRRGRARWIPFVTLLPAAAFAGWMRVIGVRDVFFRLPWSEITSNFPQRASIVLGGFSEILANGRINAITRGRLPAEGLAGLIIALTILLDRWRRSDSSAVVSLLLGISFVTFVFAALVATPLEIRWHVATSVGRLLLLPSLFLVLTAFLFLRDVAREQ